MSKNAIFIAATGQNVGKTTLCLGLIAALKKKFPSVGFIKPVGQQHVQIDDHTNVDKDAVLFKHQFQIDSDWSDMSPVIIPAGFTRDFLDGKVSEDAMRQAVVKAFKHVHEKHTYTIVEGTGHVGVGSIVNLNNAHIASLLGLEVVIIASGGLGSAFDELMLNIALCQHYNVNIKGVILNKVLEDKREMILNYFPKILSQWNIPLIGAVPYSQFLSTPTIKDFENLFKANLLSGITHRYRHFQNVRLVACSLEAYRNQMISNELIITPASREDIIYATLQKHIESSEIDGFDFGGGMILTSHIPPSNELIEQIKRVNIPILYAPYCSYDVMKKITSYIAKIRWEDTPKVDQAISLVEKHINLDFLCSKSTIQ